MDQMVFDWTRPTHCQRWRNRRSSYRPAGETIRTANYEIATIATDREARSFIEAHHYSGAYVAARLRVGLYRGGELVGAAVFSQPASQAALDAALPMPELSRVELGRFVLLDDVEANGESWFLARGFELARAHGFDAIVAHSDPEPRVLNGSKVWPGHIGTIYQATNASYQGRTPARTWRMFEDGTVFSARAWSKLRSQERGYRYAVEQLCERGAAPPSGDWREWVQTAVASVTRPYRHGGTHRYVWVLGRKHRAQRPISQPYPKRSAPQPIAA